MSLIELLAPFKMSPPVYTSELHAQFVIRPYLSGAGCFMGEFNVGLRFSAGPLNNKRQR